MPATPAPPFRMGLTPERIVEVALQLTEEQHVFGWSIRDLARGLDVTPSVIHHHVGGKDLLCWRAAERVLAGLVAPPEELRWSHWLLAGQNTCSVNSRPGLNSGASRG